MIIEDENTPASKNDLRVKTFRNFKESLDDATIPPGNSLNIQPIEKLVLIDQILETIGRLIAEGSLKPGDALPGERDLSEMLKVSRTSLSQALKALDVLGVLEINPGSRTFLNKSITKLLINPMKFMTLLHNVSVVELFQTRRIIEVSLTRLAAENATEEDLEKMRIALEQSKENINNIKQYLVHEMDFHDSIFKASGNRILSAFMASINNLLIEVREKTAVAYLDLKDSLQQHIRIFNAIRNREPEKAGNAMLDHLSKIESIVSKIPDFNSNEKNMEVF